MQLTPSYLLTKEFRAQLLTPNSSECSIGLRKRLILLSKVINAVALQTIEEKEKRMEQVLPLLAELRNFTPDFVAGILVCCNLKA